MKTISVSLPDKVVAHLEQRVARGEFDSLDDALAFAVVDGFSALGNATPKRETDAELRAKIEASIDQYATGRFVDGEEFMDRMDRKFDGVAAGPVKAQ